MTKNDSQNRRPASATFRTCACCNGTRLVEGITETRPCSRCNITAFRVWADNRLTVKPEPKGGAA